METEASIGVAAHRTSVGVRLLLLKPEGVLGQPCPLLKLLDSEVRRGTPWLSNGDMILPALL